MGTLATGMLCFAAYLICGPRGSSQQGRRFQTYFLKKEVALPLLPCVPSFHYSQGLVSSQFLEKALLTFETDLEEHFLYLWIFLLLGLLPEDDVVLVGGKKGLRSWIQYLFHCKKKDVDQLY